MKTEVLPSHLCQEINKCERHGEGAQQDVGDGEVRDEDVPCRQHLLDIETLGLKKDFLVIFVHVGKFLVNMDGQWSQMNVSYI